MISNNELHQLLQVWSETTIMADIDHGEQDHLNEQTLFNMAQPAGLAQASEADLNHLSSCPRCLQEFADWHGAIIDGEQTSTNTTIMAYGLRQAAASDGPVQPQTLTSTCGRFILGIYPEVENPKRGMITLDLVKDTGELHGKIITVRDGGSALLLDGSLQRGRLARIIDNLDELDLSSWTISEQEPQS